MDDLIDRSHFKSISRLYPLIHKHYPNMSKTEIIEVIKQRLHDRQMKLKQKKPYMRAIFEPVIGCYFHDFLQQTDDRNKALYPNYYHIFLESNSRYAFAYPVEDKSAETAVKTLEQFIKDNHGKPIRKLTSDGERGFDSKKFTDYCHKNNIVVKIILDKAHTTLGLMDRFIRTLRDMNQPPNRSKVGTQYKPDYVDIRPEKMRSLISSYNNTFHKTIKCTPKEMYDNPELEKEWIQRKLKLQQIQDNIEDFNLPIGTYVRYRMNDVDLGGKKRRSQFSREKYKVIGKVGARYVLKDKSGHRLTKSRFELIKADDDDPDGDDFTTNVLKSSRLYTINT